MSEQVSANPVHKPSAKPLADGNLFSKDWLLQFAKHLQTTLSVEQLLEVFAEDSMTAIRFTGLQFSRNRNGQPLMIGTRGKHACSYELVLSDQPLGELVFSRDERFSDAETYQLEFLISNLIYPLRNALLYQDALLAAARDPLTGTYNRTALENALPREIRLAQRHDNSLAVLMLDLDHFKSVNDNYGHITGDCVLKAFVERVAHHIRLSDMLFRYGGEEFTVLLPNTDRRGAMMLAERIRTGIEEMHIQCDSVPLQVTVSIGVSTLDADDSTETLLDRADSALYDSKAAGRNRLSYR